MTTLTSLPKVDLPISDSHRSASTATLRIYLSPTTKYLVQRQTCPYTKGPYIRPSRQPPSHLPHGETQSQPTTLSILQLYNLSTFFFTSSSDQCELKSLKEILFKKSHRKVFSCHVYTMAKWKCVTNLRKDICCYANAGDAFITCIPIDTSPRQVNFFYFGTIAFVRKSCFMWTWDWEDGTTCPFYTKNCEVINAVFLNCIYSLIHFR